MTKSTTSTAQSTARLAGSFYLLMGLSGAIALFARRGLIVAGDAAATMTNILAHRQLFLLGFTGDLLVPASFVVITALLYQLFQPVDKRVSLLAAFFGLAACTIQALACSFELAPFLVLDNAPFMNVYKLEQLQALAYLFLKFYSNVYGVALVFFGFYCALLGYLILRSTFLPRLIGVLMLIAGLAGLVFLSPLFSAQHLGYIMPFFIGELVFYAWLLFAGVNVGKWEERHSAMSQEL